MIDPKQAKKKLTAEQYNVCFLKGTEPPFSGKYTNKFDKGVYYCTVCGQSLFKSETKFQDWSGWPAFDQPVSKDAVSYQDDNTYGMKRVELLCSNCGAHLGHVFPDGPKETTGKRYCVNSLALEFKPGK